MKISPALMAFVIALLAAIGNAMVTYGQKKSGPFHNPYFYGGASLLLAGMIMIGIACFFKMEDWQQFIRMNFGWICMAASGLVILNIFLYLLFRWYGASYYTLYSVLAVLTTSILLSVAILKEPMNKWYWISILFAVLSIFFFMKGSK